MFIQDLFENVNATNTVVVYPGRFQPWHLGHQEVYKYLVKNFGRDRVYIATSNKVAPPRSPFSFAEKLEFMHLTGVSSDVVIETTDPYRVPELVGRLDAANTRLIFAVSQKDMDEDPRFKFGTKKDGTPTYFQPMPRDGQQMQSLAHHAYILVAPTFQFTVLGKPMSSATDVRKLFAESDNETQRQIIVDLFGRYSPEVHTIMTNKISLNEALKPNSLMALQTAKQQIARATQDEVASWEQDFLKNVAAKKGIGVTHQAPTPTAQPAPAKPTEKHSVLKSRLANLNIAIAKQQQLDTLRAKAEAQGLMYPGLEADTDTSLYVRDGHKDNYQSLNQKLDAAIQAIKSRMSTRKIAYKESTVNEFAPGNRDSGNRRSKLLASVGRLIDGGNKVDWQVPGQMGHVTRVQDDGITMKRWKMPRSKISFFLPMSDDSRDSKYTIKMVAPKHYAVVSAEHDVTETINSAILNPRFKHKQVIGDYTYTATADDFDGSPLLYVKAYDKDKQIGEVMFEIIVRSPGGRRMPSADYLESGGTEVDPAYRNKGVASTMYAYAKMLGNDIQASYNQTSQGRAMWAAWGKSGDAKHLIGSAAESAVAEGSEQHKCPPATQDIALNLKNRQKAIDEYGYGPLNPDMPNRKFWMVKQDEWNLDSPEEAKQSLCGNCAAFDQRKETLDCIAQGIGSDQGAEDPTIDAGDLGYCRFLKFKCASRRTCDAWVTGGPLTDKQDVAEAQDSDFVGFMNKALGQKTDAATAKSSMPNFMKDAPVAGLDAMGYKAALNFGIKTLNKLAPTQKTKLATQGEEGVVKWLAAQANKQGFLATGQAPTLGKFMIEDLEEVQDFLSDFFKDPAITSWALVLTDGEPLPKAPVAGPFTISINPGIPGENGYANSDWKELDTLDNLPDARELAQGLAKRNPKQFIGIWAANGKSAGFYWPGQGWRGLKEGNVIQGKFGTGKYYKNPDIEIPMYDPVLERPWHPAYSGGNPQESFYKFEVQPASATVSHIVGVHNGKRVRISTAQNELANALVDAYNRGGFTDKHIEKVPLGEEPYEYSSPGASSAQTQRIMNKMHPADNKFVWKKPNQIGGSFAESDLLRQGFKKSQYGAWGGTQAMWNRLLGIKESGILNRPTPTLRDLINKYPDIPQDELISQLQLGVRTEFEHTKDAKSATEIALDHLNEKPNYYTLLGRAGLE